MLLTVLDLEGRKGLKKKHISNICRIRYLKYLSLRYTDVAQLPKQIEQLKHLETLEIRETRVQRLDVVLPMLRNLLAGSVDNVRSKESLSTVCMPRHIVNMEKLVVLCQSH
jgi:disease resistance protein RPM1